MASRSAMYRTQDYKTSSDVSNSYNTLHNNREQPNHQGNPNQGGHNQGSSNPVDNQQGQVGRHQDNTQMGHHSQIRKGPPPNPRTQIANINQGNNQRTPIDPRWEDNKIGRKIPNDMYPSMIRHTQQEQQQEQQQHNDYKNHIVNNKSYKMPNAFYKRSSANQIPKKYNPPQPSIINIIDDIFDSASSYIQALDNKDDPLHSVAEALTSRKLNSSDKLVYIVIIIILALVVFLLLYKIFKHEKTQTQT